MYDTLEIPLLPGTSFSERIASFKFEVESVSDPLKSDILFSRVDYRQVVDLRRVADIDAVLHLNARNPVPATSTRSRSLRRGGSVTGRSRTRSLRL